MTRPMTWDQAMDHARAVEAQLHKMLAAGTLPRKHHEALERMLSNHVQPVIAADNRNPVTGAAPLLSQSHLRGLSEDQIAHYRLLMRKGYRKVEALEAATRLQGPASAGVYAERPTAKPRPIPFRLRGLTPRQLDDYHLLTRKGGYHSQEALAMPR